MLSCQGSDRRLSADGQRMTDAPDIVGSTVDGSVSLTARIVRLFNEDDRDFARHSRALEIVDSKVWAELKLLQLDMMVGVSGSLTVDLMVDDSFGSNEIRLLGCRWPMFNK